MLGLVAILSKWRNYQIALEEKEKGSLFLLNFKYNFPKVIAFRLSLLCFSSQLPPDNNLVEFTFLGEKRDLYNINTHILTKLDLDVEINSICDV